MTDTRTNSPKNPVTVQDLHVGLRNTLRAFFHGKIDESTVIDRVQFMAMLAYPTPDAHQVQQQMDEAREDYQNDAAATVLCFLQDLNTIEQETESDDEDPTNPESDHQANRKAADLVRADKTNQPITAADAIHKATASARASVCIELAHREALAEDKERDARDWSAFLAQVEVTKAAEVEAAHVEALAEEAEREPEADRQARGAAVLAEARKVKDAADVREQSDMDE